MKIALLGLGVEGKSAQHYFAKQVPTPDITVFDPITPAEVATRDWSEYDLVLRSPSLPPVGQGLAAQNYPTPAELANYQFSSLTKYFFTHCPAPILGVTGTKGKGTTCSLAAAVLKEICKSSQHHVWLVGNIGQPALDDLPQIQAQDFVVFELSSFQLWDLEQSPHVAVVLGIEPDHLNVHRDYAEYVAAKSQIVRHQSAQDFCIYNQTSADATAIAQLSPGQKLAFPATKAPAQLAEALDALRLLGAHNRDNAEAALLAVASMLDLSLAELLERHLPEVKAGLASFQGLPHRLEHVRTVNGVDFYDSSYSTDATAMQAALASFPKRSVVLILGGHDKTHNQDFATIQQILTSATNLKHLILMGESGNALARELSNLNLPHTVIPFPASNNYATTSERDPNGTNTTNTTSNTPSVVADPAGGASPSVAADSAGGTTPGVAAMEQAVQAAWQHAEPGDVVLLSPAAASFDLYQNASDRGAVFQATTLELK